MKVLRLIRLCRWPSLRRLYALIVVAILGVGAVHAHLMVAQQGTLNFVGTGGFVVMSLPVDAFTGIDDNGDGRLSADELRVHSKDIAIQIQAGLQLLDGSGPRPLEALMLSLSPDDTTPTAPAAQLVVLGRFALGDIASTGDAGLAGLTLRFSLFGRGAASQQQTITVSHGTQKQKLVLAAGRNEGRLFPSAIRVMLDNAALGAEHVLSGWDHLLFLLVVLATGWGLRQIVLALTCFTFGHGLTLAASAFGNLNLPASIVEPSIAATIIGMALFDRWSKTQPRAPAPALRLGLIFACALIHGLGFAGALTALGVDPAHRLLSLVGFNLGIEAAQLAVALVAAVLMFGVRRFRGVAGIELTARFASFSAMAVGSIWLVERLVNPN